MDTPKVLKHSRSVVRIAIGLTFVISAVSKLISIDSFELYLYSFKIFSYASVTILSRLLVATEFFIGLSLIFRLHYKKIWFISLILMVFFTIFLIYVIRFRNDESCNCFGDLIDLDPKQSLAKNIILTCFLIFIGKIKDYDYKPKIRKSLIGVFLGLSIIVPFIIVPNDLIYNKIYSEKENINTVAFGESLNDSTYVGYLKVHSENLDDTIVFDNKKKLMDVSEGRYLINYAVAGCKYCRMGAERLAIMAERHGIENERMKFIVGGSPYAMSLFIKKTNTYGFDHWEIAPNKLMDITLGRFPLYVFVENGNVVKAVDFRHLNENEVVEFLLGD